MQWKKKKKKKKEKEKIVNTPHPEDAISMDYNLILLGNQNV